MRRRAREVADHLAFQRIEKSGEAAIAHVADSERLAWLATAADIAESLLYLQVSRQLQAAGLIAHTSPARGHGTSGEPDVDRVGLRVLLLDTWLRALVAGHVAPQVPLSRTDRKAVVDQLSVLACTGLERGTRDVTFDDFDALHDRQPAPAFLTAAVELPASDGRQFDTGLAARWGTELGLAEAQPGGVRFPDSIIQAYLASRLIEAAMADEPYRNTALAAPGRELLTALVMSSRPSTFRSARAGEFRSQPASRPRRRARARGPAARERREGRRRGGP